MNERIAYGFSNNASLVLQLNYMPWMNLISFYNWEPGIIGESEEPYIVAVWKFKERHPLPINS